MVIHPFTRWMTHPPEFNVALYEYSRVQRACLSVVFALIHSGSFIRPSSSIHSSVGRSIHSSLFIRICRRSFIHLACIRSAIDIPVSYIASQDEPADTIPISGASKDNLMSCIFILVCFIGRVLDIHSFHRCHCRIISSLFRGRWRVLKRKRENKRWIKNYCILSKWSRG